MLLMGCCPILLRSRVQSLVHLFSFYLLMILLTVWISARLIIHLAVFLQTIWKFIAHMTPFMIIPPFFTLILRNIERWSSLWQLRINPEKSILLQVGSVPPGHSQYGICNQIIQSSIHVRDLGLLIYDSKLCFKEYIAEIVARAFQRVNLLLRSFISGNVLILTKAYITYVRPLLEYCTYLWSPYQNYLIDKIERVQRYFSRRVLFRTKLPYLTRLKILKLETLEMRRIKFDLKLCYKIINGLCDLNFNEFFTFASSSVTRDHNYKLIKPLSKNNWLLDFYSSRVVPYWNSLPSDVVSFSSFAIFVKKLNLVDFDKFCIGGRA